MRGRDQILLEGATEKVVNPKLKALKKFVNPLPTDQDKFNFLKKFITEEPDWFCIVYRYESEQEMLKDLDYSTIEEVIEDEHPGTPEQIEKYIYYAQLYYWHLPLKDITIISGPGERGKFGYGSYNGSLTGFKNVIMNRFDADKENDGLILVFTKF